MSESYGREHAGSLTSGIDENKFDQISNSIEPSEAERESDLPKGTRYYLDQFRLMIEKSLLLAPFELSRPDSGSGNGRYRYKFYYPAPNLRNCLRRKLDSIVNSAQDPPPRRSFEKCPPRIFAIHVFYVYMMVKLALSGILQLRYKRLSEEYRPALRDNRSSTKHCALSWDIIEPKNLAQLERTSFILDFLGSPFTLRTEFVSLAFVLAALVPATFYIGVLMYRKRTLVPDSYNFLKDPDGERRELREILAKNIEDQFEYHDHELGPTARPSIVTTNIYRHEHVLSMPAERIIRGISSYSCRYREKFCRDNFFRFIREENLNDFVIPAHRKNKVLRWILFMKLTLFTLVLTICIVGASTLHWSLFEIELMLRTSRRIEWLKCRQWNPNGTLIRDPSRMMLHRIDSKYLSGSIRVNKEFNFEDILYLELREFWRECVILGLELNLIAMISAAWASIHIVNCAGNYVSRFVWVQQLQDQLDNCLRLMDEFILIRDSQTSIDSKFKYKARLEKAITISYLNFCLFKKESKSQVALQNYYGEQVAISATGTLGFSFLILSSVDSKNANIIYAVTIAMLAVSNLFLTISASLTRRIQRIFHTLNEVLAKASTNSMELSYIIGAWRRQVLTDSQVEDVYSTSAFGLKLTSSSLITFNSSVFGICLVMYQKSNSPERVVA